jgi:hypothetical protein
MDPSQLGAMSPTTPRPVSRWRTDSDPGRAFVLAIASIAPLLVWWLGWFPGFMSSDSMDQWGQVLRFDFSNTHPAFHTWLMWLVTRAWTTPGAVTLVQVIAMSVVLALLAKRLSEFGAVSWISGTIAIGLAALPAVAATTVTVWKDVPFTIAILWLFAELLGLGAHPERWTRAAPALRIGLALALIWLLRHNGFITVLVIAPCVLWRQRRSVTAVASCLGMLVGFVATVHLVLYPLADVDRSVTGVTLFLPDIAASYVHEPENFTTAEIQYLDSYAPRGVWEARYRCSDAVPLLFDPAFHRERGAEDPGRLTRLLVSTYLRDPDTILGHRWCVARYLVVPWQVGSDYFHRPPWDIPDNDLGVQRDPLSYKAFAVTSAVYRWVNHPGRLWLTWRPALPLWLAGTALVWAWFRGRVGAMWLPIVLLLTHVVNVALTSTAHEFRFAFPIYLMSWWLIAFAVLGHASTVPTAAAEDLGPAE